jgi:archaemetzincin
VNSKLIEIVTIGDVGRDLARELSKEIERAFRPAIEGCLLGASLNLPPAAHDPTRNQYDADLILDRVFHRVTGNHKVLGLLNVDLYTPSQNLNFIFGQAQLRGRVALVSLCRLDQRFYGRPADPELLFNRLTKESIHELGHAFGLPHCSDRGCVMSFSNSILDVDRKGSSFCKSCRRKLQTTFTIRVWR